MEVSVAVAVLCIAAGGIGSQWLAWRFRIPAIVLLFAMGLAVGPGLGLIHPSAALGSALRPLVSLAVAIVVFEGGLSLTPGPARRWRRRAAADGGGSPDQLGARHPREPLDRRVRLGRGGPVRRDHGRHGADRRAALAAACAPPTPDGFVPALGGDRERSDRRDLAALTLEVLAGSHSGAGVAGVLVGGVAVSIVLGVGAGLLVKWSFGRDLVPEFLKTPMLLALILTIASLSNLAMPEAGLMSATIFGVAVANLGITGISELRRFKESLVVLLVSTLFVTLTADLDRSVLSSVGWRVAALTAAMMVLVRPAAICSRPCGRP